MFEVLQNRENDINKYDFVRFSYHVDRLRIVSYENKRVKGIKLFYSSESAELFEFIPVTEIKENNDGGVLCGMTTFEIVPFKENSRKLSMSFVGPTYFEVILEDGEPGNTGVYMDATYVGMDYFYPFDEGKIKIPMTTGNTLHLNVFTGQCEMQ